MNKRDAKRVAHRIAAGMIQRWLDAGEHEDEDLCYEDVDRVEKALLELVDHHFERSSST